MEHGHGVAVQPRHAWFNNSTLTRRVLTLSGHWPRSESASAFGFARAWELYSAFTIPDFNWPDDIPRARLEGRPELPVSSFGTCLEGRPWSISTIHISNHFDPLHSHLKKKENKNAGFATAPRDASAHVRAHLTRTVSYTATTPKSAYNYANAMLQNRVKGCKKGTYISTRSVHQDHKHLLDCQYEF